MSPSRILRALDGENKASTCAVNSEKLAEEEDESRKLAFMAAQARKVLLCLAALYLPVFANVPKASLISEKPHQGGIDFAGASHRGLAAAKPLIAPGIDGCLCDEGRRSRSTGKERDAETGLDYFGARYLGSGLGRFSSPDEPLLDQDPSDPQSWNLYAYVRNNPLVFVDPTGQCSVKPGAKQATDDPDEPCVDSSSTSVTVTAEADEQPLSPYAQEFVDQMSRRASASNQMIGTVAVGSTAAGAAVGSGAVVAVIDGVGYTSAQLAALGSVTLARLVATGKLPLDAIQRLSGHAPMVASQVYLRLFAQSNNTTIPQGWLNNNNYLRIGEGFAPGGPVFRIAIGSKHVPLPNWVPGLIKGTYHINLWRR